MKISTRKKILTTATTGMIILLPALAMAQINNFCDIVGLVNTIARWFGTIVFVIAVAAILYAAFLFLTAGGNEESLTTAKKTLIYGIIGIAVALLAVNSFTIIKTTTGGSTSTFNSCTPTPNSTNLIFPTL